MRISRDQMFMEMARAAAKRSTCFRLNVGAVLVTPSNRVISIGYNGQPSGEAHCTTPCAEGACHTIHAERNALDRSAYFDHIGCTLYVTDSPCLECAKAMVKTRVGRVVFETHYRVQDGVKYLIDLGVVVQRLLPSGAMILVI